MPPNQTSSKPRDLKISVLNVHPEWNVSSKGRHHIFLFDGTWNDETGINPAEFTWDNERHVWVSRADASRSFAPIVSNVVKTHLALAPDSLTQLTHYFRGVGNDNDFDAANVLSEGGSARYEPFIRNLAYCQFVENYRTGDRVSILGFSRGAASARLFARDLANYGLLDLLMIESRFTPMAISADLRRDVWTLWPRKAKKLIPGEEIPIAFLGVWDTVSTSLSADDDDWKVPANVRRAVHCVALDETRVLFEPTLLSYDPARAADMKEVWFPGVHCDIGGGYFCDGLARQTLDFMWRCWNKAVTSKGQPKLKWRPKTVSSFSKTTGLPWLRHNEAGGNGTFLVAPRSCVAPLGGRPRVHPSVERFVQQGGLQFCREDNSQFPPACTISAPVYQPLAYPGAAAVELYDSTAWT